MKLNCYTPEPISLVGEFREFIALIRHASLAAGVKLAAPQPVSQRKIQFDPVFE